MDHLDRRRRLCAQLGSRLAALNDAALLQHLGRTGHRTGWGRSQVLALGRQKVFVKRIPVTARELANPHATRNLHRLPTYYSYGVGSAGFGVHRELLAHVKTSNWVLEGAAGGFPLLYHHRVVSLRRSERAQTQHALDIEAYQRYWNGSRRVGRFITDRAAATHEMLLFLEWFPETLAAYLPGREAGIEAILDDLMATVAFLRSRGIVHFDAHAFNVLCDGERFYLSDFGLLLDQHFELRADERRFLDAHRRYDEGTIVYQLGLHLLQRFRKLRPASQRTLAQHCRMNPDDPNAVLRGLVEYVDDAAVIRAFALPDAYVAATLRRRPVIRIMNDFFRRMFAGTRKSGLLDTQQLNRALTKQAGLRTPPSDRTRPADRRRGS